MGAEHSKEEARNRKNLIDEAVQRALAQQQQLNQNRKSLINEAVKQALEQQRDLDQKRQHASSSTTNSLYPNIQNISRSETVQDLSQDVHQINRQSCSSQSLQQGSRSTTNNLYPAFLNHSPSNTQFHENLLQTNALPYSPQYQFRPTVPSAPQLGVEVKEKTHEQTYNSGAIPKYGTRNEQRQNKPSIGVNCVTCSGRHGVRIYQCQNGHSSCQKCKGTNKLCGTCSKPITNMRNITLEGLVADMTINTNKNNDRISCTYARDGCSLSFSKESLANHLKECPFMALACPLSTLFGICKWQGKVSQLHSHFHDMHPEHCVAEVGKEMTLMSSSAECNIVHFIKIGSFNFLFHIKRDSNNTIYMTARLFGTKVSASKWLYEVNIYNKNAPKRKFSYIDSCNSFSEPVDDIFNSGRCVTFKPPYSSTFFIKNMLNYNFLLTRIANKKGKQRNEDNN